MDNLELSIFDVTCFRTLVRHCRSESHSFELCLDHDDGIPTFSVKVYDGLNELVGYSDAKSLEDVVKLFFEGIGKH